MISIEYSKLLFDALVIQVGDAVKPDLAKRARVCAGCAPMLNALEAELVAALLDRRYLVHITLAYRAAVIRLLLLLLRLLQYRMAIYFLQPFESAPLLLNFEGARLPLRLFMSLTLLQH